MVGQGRLEQGGGVGGFGEQGAAVVDGGERPRPPGALGERDELLHPRRGLFAVAGADGGVDAVEGDETAEGAQPDAGEVVQRGRGVAVVGGAGALRPPHQVVHRVGEHAERLLCRLVEVGEQRVVLGVGSALEGGEQSEPAERYGAERPLPGADAERERFLGELRSARHRPVTSWVKPSRGSA